MFQTKTLTREVHHIPGLKQNVMAGISHQIETLEDLSHAMQDIKSFMAASGNNPVLYALNAQLKVISSISSSTLVDSTFDLIFAEFKKAIKHSSEGIERDAIREKIHVYMNNYLFFLDAKLKHSFKKDDEDTEALIEEGAKLIAQNSADIMMLASGGGAIKVAVSKIAFQIAKKSTQKPGIFKRVIRLINKKKRQERAMENFQQTLDFLFQKLDKNKNVIGRSDITAGLVNRWKEEVLQYRRSKRQFTVGGVILGSVFSLIVLTFYNNLLETATLEYFLAAISFHKVLYTFEFLICLLFSAIMFSYLINTFIIKRQLSKLEKHFEETNIIID